MPTPTLLIAHCFTPCVQVGVHRPWRFYKYLPSYGYRPLVLTSTEQDPDKPIADVTFVETRIEPKFSLTGFLDRVLTRILIPLSVGELGWIHKCLRPMEELHRQTGFRTMLSTSPPLGSHLLALWLKRRLGVRWIADFRDPLCGNPFRGEKVLHAWVDALMEKAIFKHADILIANTDRLLDDWKRRYPQHASKMRVLWNGLDPDETLAARPIPPRSHRILGHVGHFYGNRHPGMVIESLKRLISKGQLQPGTVQFVQQGFIGGTFDECTALREEMKKMGVLVENHTVVPKEEARRILSEVDWPVLIDYPDEKPLRLPAKLFEYVRIGRPMLVCTTAGSPLDGLLAECGIPNTRLYYGSPEDEIDAKVAAFLKLPPDPVPMSESFARRFDGRLQTGELAHLLDSLTG